MEKWLDIAAAVFAILAAILWFSASRVATPTELRRVFHLRMDGRMDGDVADLARGVVEQSRKNGYAAAAAGLSAFLQAAALCVGFL